VAKEYCTDRLIKKLMADYEYEGGGYAVWDFRTDSQDGDGPSKIKSVTPIGDNQYKVSFLDMGFKGSRVITVKWVNDVPLFDMVK
jgi:hypothetical protein